MPIAKAGSIPRVLDKHKQGWKKTHGSILAAHGSMRCSTVQPALTYVHSVMEALRAGRDTHRARSSQATVLEAGRRSRTNGAGSLHGAQNSQLKDVSVHTHTNA
jgi:hypothetical protein